MEMNCREVLEAAGGRLLQAGDLDSKIRQLVIDSREVRQGDFFVPLPGEKTDGHHYLADAAGRGAVGCLVSEGKNVWIPETITVIEVADTLSALQQMCAAYRDRFALPVVAVTGSTGKTTTKDLIAAVLSARLNVLKTDGNLNNHIGVPLMLSRLSPAHEAAVLEMGMSGMGEIDLLARLARPRVGVISNIGESHLEMLGSRENIAAAKCELISRLPAGGLAVVNGDEPLIVPHCLNLRCRVVTFGFSAGCDIRCMAVEQKDGQKTVRLARKGLPDLGLPVPLPGRHSIYNLMAAVAVAEELGLTGSEIREGLSRLELSGMRLETVTTPAGVTVINDAYNASPSSMAAALDVLLELAGKAGKIAVLGDMLELGDYEEEGHRGVGRLAAELGVDALILLGGRARHIAAGAIDAGFPAGRVYHCQSHSQAGRIAGKLAKPGDWVLIKGSRGMRMEETLPVLLAEREADR
jgi:UDP-N-acetylmuramoyl-tripeptide--D-alanyl-D-alanine ligase